VCGAAGTRYPMSNSDPGAMGESKFVAHKNCNYEGRPQRLNWPINVKSDRQHAGLLRENNKCDLIMYGASVRRLLLRLLQLVARQRQARHSVRRLMRFRLPIRVRPHRPAAAGLQL
jgi:hypothetical protein